MIRTGYLRWEIEANDARSAVDGRSREVTLRARPTYRRVLVRIQDAADHARLFARGMVNYAELEEAREKGVREVELVIPDVGPHVFRYSESDRLKTPRFWMQKLSREAAAFGADVVRAAAAFPELIVANPQLRNQYARWVQQEVLRVVVGQSVPQPTNETEPMRVEIQADRNGLPELVAAELVRDVVSPEEFEEFRQFNRVTIENGSRIYRIPRRTHGLIEVWDAKTLKGEARLCVVFQDPGMPASDEVVMKYLLAKHQPELLWQVGIRFPAPTGKFQRNAPPSRLEWYHEWLFGERDEGGPE